MGERRARSGGEETPTVEESTSRPAEQAESSPAEKPAGRPVERKVKATYCLDESMATLIDSVASEMRVPSSRLVQEVMGKALRGCRRPTIPGELRTLFARKERSAV